MTADVSQQLADLSPGERSALLARLQARKQGARRADGPAPLSTAQERLWFLDRLDPGNPAHNIVFAVRIAGALDRAALDTALRAIVTRHEALRTAFVEVGGQPRQVVRAGTDPRLTAGDLRAAPDRDAALRDEVAAHLRTRFDLAGGAPMALRLLRLDAEEHLLLVAAHHIVFDGWSTGIFADELAAHYAAARTGVPPAVPDLPVRFADWAAWEREHLAGPRFDEQIAYWRSTLAGAPELSTVPTDYPRPDSQTTNGAYLPFDLPAALAEDLTALAAREGATLNAAVMAGVAAVVYRTTGQEDVLLGVSVAGRPRTDLQALIGSFADTFVLRVDLSGDPTLRELVRRTGRALAAAFRHQDVPYVRVVEEIAPPRAPSHNPLFQILLSIAEVSEHARPAAGVSFAVEQLDVQSTDFDLDLALSRQDGALRGVVGYNTDLYLPGTVEGALRDLRDVLGELAGHPDRTVGEAASLHRPTLSVVASFTADPVREPLEFWLRTLRLPGAVRIAPYGQVVQHLLGGGGPDGTVVLLRIEDWLRNHTAGTPAAAVPVLDRALRDLAGALTALRERSAAPLVVGIAPASARYAAQPWAALFARVEERLAAYCHRGDVSFLTSTAWSRRYPTAEVGDERADELGHVPYTPEFFAAIGTTLARWVYASRVRPVRTVLVDPARLPAAAVDRLRAEQERYGRQVLAAPPEPAAATDPGSCLLLDPDPDVCAQAGVPAVVVPTGPALSRFLDHLWALDPPVGPGGTVPVAPDRLGLLAEHLTDAVTVAERARHRSVALPDGPVVAPRTETERRLVALWRDMLGLAEAAEAVEAGIGVHTSFFALGGHSLLATHLLSRVHGEFGRSVPLAGFLLEPTVERLAGLLDSDTGTDAIAPWDGEPVASPNQQRLWALAQIGGDPARHNITFAATLRGPLDAAALRRAVGDVLARHEVLRTCFAERDGQPVPVVHEDVDPWLPDSDLTGSTVDDEVRAHAALPLDLARGPLVRARLVRGGPDEHHLLVVMHHIVSDGMSWDVFLRELAGFYAARTEGRASGVAPLPLRFADVAAWQRRRHDDEAAADRAAAYWRNRLAGAPPVLDLPTDRPRPQTRTDGSARHTLTFAAGLGPALREVSTAEGVSLSSTLLAGVAALLYRHSQVPDVVLGTAVSGRDRPEFDGMIGPFSDLMPLRVELAGAPTFRELVRGTHARAVEPYQYERLPFARIVEAAAPRRDPAYHPLFQCMVNVVDQQGGEPTLGGLGVDLIDVPPSGTDFDLTVSLAWRGDRLLVTLDHSTDLYDPGTVADLARCLESLLASAAGDPDLTVDALDLGPAFTAPATRPAEPTGVGEAAGPVLAVAATFDVEPLGPAARHWLAAAGLPATLRFAPYGQVLRDLLAPDGTLGGADCVNVVLLRYEDWLPHHENGAPAGHLETELADLCAALRAFAGRCAAPLVVGICPPSPRYADPYWTGLFGGLTERLDRATAELDSVSVRSLARWIEPYGAADPPGADGTAVWAVLGTAVARAAYAHLGRRVRTLVLDRDRAFGTAAWQRELARWVRRLVGQGRTVALCGTETQRVPLRPAEIAAACTGPPEDLFTGGLDPADCLVLDPDPAVVARIRKQYPEAVAVALPTGAGDLRRALRHVWPLDGAGRTADPVPDALLTPTDARSLLDALGFAHREPRTEPERILAGVWRDLLHVERVGLDDDFFEIGGDSLLAIQAVSLAAQAGVTITPRQLIDHPTVAELAELAGQGTAVNGEPDDGPTPLLPAQEWYFHTVAPLMPNISHFNHPYYLELREPVTPEQLQRALDRLLVQHDSLRLRFTPDGAGGWRQHYSGETRMPFESHDLTGLDPVARSLRMVELCSAAQRGLHVTDGPLVRAVHFGLGEHGPDRLLVVTHHLVVDGMSRGLVLEDLQGALRQIRSGQEPVLPLKTTSVQHWSRLLREYADSDDLRAELPFWLDQPDLDRAVLPPDFPDGTPTAVSYDTLRAQLGEAETLALRGAARRLGMSLGQLVLAVAAGWLSDRSGRRDVTVAIAGHGREGLFPDADLSRTVGWFQIYYPMRLRDPKAGLEHVRDQLARVRDNGIGYSLLRYCCSDRSVRDALAAMPRPVVSVNFMGDFSFASTPTGTEMFGVPTEDYGPPQIEDGQWQYLLDIVPTVIDRRLTLELNYSNNIHRRTTGERVLDELLALLTTTISEERSA